MGPGDATRRYLAHPPARQVIKGLGVTPIENGNALGLGLPANYSSMAAGPCATPRGAMMMQSVSGGAQTDLVREVLLHTGVCGDPFEGAFNGLYPVSSAPFDPVWAGKGHEAVHAPPYSACVKPCAHTRS